MQSDSDPEVTAARPPAPTATGVSAGQVTVYPYDYVPAPATACGCDGDPPAGGLRTTTYVYDGQGRLTAGPVTASG